MAASPASPRRCASAASPRARPPARRARARSAPRPAQQTPPPLVFAGCPREPAPWRARRDSGRANARRGHRRRPRSAAAILPTRTRRLRVAGAAASSPSRTAMSGSAVDGRLRGSHAAAGRGSGAVCGVAAVCDGPRLLLSRQWSPAWVSHVCGKVGRVSCAVSRMCVRPWGSRLAHPLSYRARYTWVCRLSRRSCVEKVRRDPLRALSSPASG